MRENLIVKGLKNVPTKLKGYKFSMWVANQLNRLIPNLDFPILPHFISVSHPLHQDESGSPVVIIRFAIRDVRNEVFFKRKFIRNRNVTITEHLIDSNKKLLRCASDVVGQKNQNRTKGLARPKYLARLEIR